MRHWFFLLVALALLFIVAGCGDDSGSAAPGTAASGSGGGGDDVLNLFGGKGGDGTTGLVDGGGGSGAGPDGGGSSGAGGTHADASTTTPDGSAADASSGGCSPACNTPYEVCGMGGKCEATCYLFADTFERPDGPVGDAEYPSGVTWTERQKSVALPDGGVGLESSDYAIKDGELTVGAAKGTYFDAVLPESRVAGDGTRIRFAGRAGTNALNVVLSDPTDAVVWNNLSSTRFQAGMADVDFPVDSTTLYFIEVLVQGDVISWTIGVDDYVSEGGTQVVAAPATVHDSTLGAYDRVRVPLGDGAALDEVFVEKYPCP